MIRAVRLIVGLLASLPCLPLMAAEMEAPPGASSPAPPEFARNLSRLPALVLQDKREGKYFTGIPIIGTDPDNGFTYGAQIQWYDDGPKDDPLFAYAPYRKRITINADQSTEQTSEYWLDYDQPYVGGSPWRLRGFAGYLRHRFERYFGVGEATLGKLSFPGRPGERFGRVGPYFDALREIANGETFERYNAYDRQEYVLNADVERSMLGGLLRPLAGFQISHLQVGDYSGLQVSNAVEQETKLHTDFRTGAIRGYRGGWGNLLRVGLTYDTRDYEPNPTSGVLAQVLVEGAMRWLGASGNWGHVTVTGQVYQPLFPEKIRLVLAANAVYSNHFGEVPFWDYPIMSAPSRYLKEGLGGFETLRGFDANRFVAPVQIQGNLELRWTFARLSAFHQTLDTMLVPFLDVGRVYDQTDRFGFSRWQYTGGLALRLAWTVATIISFDLGFSREGYGFYMEASQPF